jgi:hypothetical protein
MTLLIQLPVEILQQITGYLGNPDVESITISCRYLHSVAAGHLMRHREWKRTLSRFACGKDLWRGGIGKHPAQLLEKILLDHRVASYPTDLTIGDCSHHQDDSLYRFLRGSFDDDDYEPAPGTDLRYETCKLANDFCYHTPRCTRKCISDIWESFTARLLAFHKNPVVTLLLRFLPNLEVLRYEHCGWTSASPLWFQMLSEVAQESRAYPDSVFPLSKLHTVEIHPSHRGFGFLLSIMALPSLRTVRAVGQSSLATHRDMMLSLPATSNIVTIVLDGCYFYADHFVTFMSRIPNLRNFEYRDAKDNSGHASWKPRRVVECLLRYASHSLTSLTFIGYRASHHPHIGSLRGFRALSDIRIDVAMLMDPPDNDGIDDQNDKSLDADVNDRDTLGSDDEDDCLSDTISEPAWYLEVSEHTQIVHRLINVLPASAETLTLEMAADKNIMQQMLRRLPERRAERLPQLKEILYQCEERCVLGVETACESVGVKVTQVFKYGDIKNIRRDSLDSEASIDECGGWDNHDWGYWNEYYAGRGLTDDNSYANEDRLHQLCIAEAEDLVSETAPSAVYEDVARFEWLISQTPDLSNNWS